MINKNLSLLPIYEPLSTLVHMYVSLNVRRIKWIIRVRQHPEGPSKLCESKSTCAEQFLKNQFCHVVQNKMDFSKKHLFDIAYLMFDK